MERIYEHRTFGRIGHVALEAPKGEWKLDGQTLPQSSIDHLLNFALQTLQDAYAGAESADDAKARWAKKRDNLLNGTIGVRSGSGGEEPVMRYIREIVRKLLGEENRKKYADMKGDADGRAEFLTGLFNGLPEDAQKAIRATAEEEMEADRKRKEAAQKRAAKLEVSL